MLMRIIAGLAIAAGAIFSGGSAGAADLPVAPAYRAAPAVAPVFDWTGFYIGANIGYGWGRGSVAVGGFSGSENLNGVLGGGQIGYNWQTGNWIFGIEVDGQATDQKATFAALGLSETDSMPWFATARGRIGYAIAPMWMIYATGGGAWADFKSTITAAGLGSATWEVSHGGWSAGVGVEGALTRNWSWKVEYLHLDTGSFSTNVFGIVPANVRLTDDIVRFGANFRL
jgi:outer membrane immunogenic protein